MKIKKFLILFITIFISFQNVNAQKENANYKFKALFIYNFTKYINWPVQYKTGNFVIAVLGNAKITPELKKILSTKRCGNQLIEIREYPIVEHIAKCHILYIPTGNSKLLPKVMNRMHGKSILIITEGIDLIENGACINFIKLPNGKLSFELNIKEANNRKLVVNNVLSDQLAHKVIK